MSVFTKTDADKLSIMYEGDKNRDATSKIRGFLFQDYVAIMCLFQDKVRCVCSEYLEDVDVFYEDGTFEFIQVKYYPKTDPNMKEISTDLYYQYLRLQMLKGKWKAKPSFYIYGKSDVKKPTLDKMKEYIGLGKELPKSPRYPSPENPVTWLQENVYKTNKKDEQKKTLFAAMASENSLKEFVEAYNISNQSDIDKYKDELKEKLAQAYPNPNKNVAAEHWKSILLGLAILRIQQRYTLDDPDFDKLKFEKKDIDQYIQKSFQTNTEQTIVGYLVDIVCEKYGEIIAYNDLSDLQTHMLNLIYQNTIRWISEISKDEEGQYQLLNTLSESGADKIAGYKEATVDARLLGLAECKGGFRNFLDYLWKIMLNICQEKVHDEAEISADLELFDPFHYWDNSVTEYVCLNFPEDKYTDRTVILPRAGGNFPGLKRKIVERMVKLSQKPGKWFLADSKLRRGKNYYNYSTANVNENPTVADLGEESFYIECMDCIRIEDGGWNVKEACGDCIFSMKCVKEGE